jgi:hypothetical protein
LETNNITNTLQTFGARITDALKSAVPPNRDTSGALKQSISFSISFAGFPVHFELLLADYYKFIDAGRSPGRFPPPDVIKAWIKNKRLNIQPYSSLTSTSKKTGSIRPEMQNTNRLAFLIGRKIARTGIAPTNFYSNTITTEVLNELQQNLSAAFKQDVLVSLLV